MNTRQTLWANCAIVWPHKNPLSLLCLSLNSLSSLSLPVWERCLSPFKELSLWSCAGLTPVSPYHSSTSEPQTALRVPRVASAMFSKGERLFPSVFWGCTSYVVFSLLSIRALWSWSQKLPSSQSASSLYWCTWSSFAFTELHKVPVNPSLQPVKVFLSSSTAMCCTHLPPSLVSSAKLAEGALWPIMQVINGGVKHC